MNDETIRHELRRVGLRYRALLRWAGLLVCWTVFALGGLVVLAWSRGAGHTVPGIALILLLALPVVAIPAMFAALRATRDPLWIARRIEKRYPELDTRLLAALEQKPDEKTQKLGYLQKTIIDETLVHAYTNHWEKLVSPGKLRLAKWSQWAMLAVFVFVIGALTLDMSRRPGKGSWWLGSVTTKFEIQVEPQDTNLERNTSLLVLARFNGSEMPTDVQLLSRDEDGKIQQVPMSKSLNDPVFASRVASVKRDMSYAVRYGDAETKWYKVSVFDFPQLKQADANLKYPQYTGLSDKLIQDTRSVTAVEGTKATFTLRLNKPVADAQLIPKPGPQNADAMPINLSVDPKDPSVYTFAADMKQSQRYTLDLVDEQGRKPKESTELVLNVTANQPPTVQSMFPGHDVDASPLQEINFKARVWDDFGVKRVGMSYTMSDKPQQDLVLAENVPAKEKRDVAQLVSLEKLSAEPDQLLSYYFWAEDSAPDGTVRRTSGDMFFAEVRPFEEIYRQGEQPAGGQQQQQQQQQQGNQNAQQAEDLADLQKDIISATWKVMRRETFSKPTTQFTPDVKSINESQASAKEQATALGQRLQDARSKAFLESVLKHMDDASKQLDKASGGPIIDPMAPALAAEQAAYQDLLKLRAREHEVVRGNQAQRGGNSSASSRRQRQMNQLDLANQDNKYETQRAAQQQDQNPQQRETRQVLSRLRELAQRQEDLNRQMRELQSALQQARDQEQRDEIQRQLARLRDQQQQQLRDTDELRDRMDQPENQERMADSRQQLEQTRENVRRASEELDQQNVANASAAGARASEQLNNLRDDFRKATSGQFGEAMQQMRYQARQLDQTEQQLAQRLGDLNNPTTQRTLRDAGDRQQIADGFNNQRQQLDKLMDNMRRTIEDAETPEPLLSKQLYDTVRQAAQQNPEKTLDATKQLLDRGFVDEARQAEAQANKTITSVRQGVEKAAESVLGDPTEALRRARNELDNLANQLDREIQRNAPQASAVGTRGQPSTRQAGGQAQAGNNADEPNGQNRGDQQANGEQPGQGDRGNQQANGGQRGNRAGQQPGDRTGQGRQGQGDPAQASGRRGNQPGQGRGDGQQQGDEQNPQLADAGQRGQGNQPGARQGGARQGRGQQPGRGQGQGQGDDQQQGDEQNPQLADAGQPGQGGQPGGRQGQGGARQGQGQQPGGNRAGGGLRGNQPQRGNGGGGGNANADPELARAFGRDGRDGLNQPDGQADQRGPLTGDNFRDWADRLRDVEEMVDDPQLRAQAAQIRDRARAIRSDMTRHSQPPNWNMVVDMVSKPLVELRDSVNQELMRRESSQALVPVDREPVPPEYAEQVRRYYERLGSGK